MSRTDILHPPGPHCQDEPSRTREHLHLATLRLSVAAVAALMVAGWTDVLTYDRSAIADGQLWRLFTGHLTHWNLDHLLWDVLAFFALGALIEQRSRRTFLAALGLSTVAISATLMVGQPALIEYRGLSGIDSGLFTAAAVLLFGEVWRKGKKLLAGAIVLAMLGFLAKIAYELTTGATLFVDSAAAGFVPLPLAHAVGGAAGIVAVWATRAGGNRWQTRQTRDSNETTPSWSTSAAKGVTRAPGI